ncbi:hypothetical protein [Sporomusa sphaeroides]|uniref:Uncharacterized protein n=1 Tax=Sporomusa sphaeroides DSM 2875 TaxID=1337886 RepID=A0ABM9W008_9FIRM|nr:hypothetical protein [Sporomusa sphaeroides]OLS56403.1 hypothetical protein SPSPH_27960 [Sporomusa sphaeroides DSM 2875]CVK18498.1 hypothetical protein SSPH_01136 [Sporomusa sphaeroides DSM 2875]
MDHQYREPKDCNCNGEPGCMVCDGGLSICKVCGLMEGSLTTDCPGEWSGKKSEEIYAGNLDYREGQGWVEEKNPTNQMWERARNGTL